MSFYFLSAFSSKASYSLESSDSSDSWESFSWESSDICSNSPILNWMPLFSEATPVLPFIPEFFRFEMILAWISDLDEVFKLITLFINSMWKSWLLVTKLGTALLLATIFIMSSRSVSTKALIVLAISKEAEYL